MLYSVQLLGENDWHTSTSEVPFTIFDRIKNLLFVSFPSFHYFIFLCLCMIVGVTNSNAEKKNEQYVNAT